MTSRLSFFKFCPHCGSARFVDNDFKSRHCLDCGFVYYLNPSAATAAFVVDGDGRMLVVRRKLDPAKGTLDLPGGFSDVGESLEEGIAREVMEETSLEVSDPRFLFSLPNDYLYSGFHVPTLDSFFLCRTRNAAAVHAADDAASAEWVDIGSVRAELFGLASVRKAVTEFLRNTSEYLKK